jgi:hypothetical protein
MIREAGQDKRVLMDLQAANVERLERPAADVDSAPQPDAIDVQFRAPQSLTLLIEGLRGTGKDLDARPFETAYEEVANWTAGDIRRHADRALGSGGRERAEVVLDVAVVLEDLPVGLHHHVVVRRRATYRDGPSLSVGLDDLRETLTRSVWGGYLRQLREGTSALGLVWGRPLPGAPYEIVDPPLAEHVVEREASQDCACPRYASEVIPLPDPATIEREAREQSAVLTDAARSGSSYWTPPRRG